MIRIIAGTYRGKKLFAGTDLSIRPLTNKIRESIFNTLGDFVHGKNVLDLFSGSGSFGLEALSRSAAHITFIEKNPVAFRILNENLDTLNITSDHALVFRADVYNFIKRGGQSYHLILMDPPFKFSNLQTLLAEIMAGDLLEKGGLLVVHHEVSNPLDLAAADYQILKQRKFGRNIVSFLCHEVNHA